MALSPDERARKAADAMWAADKASPWFGMSLVEVAEGTAILRLTVQEHHCNGHGICHGGIIFSLADSAFAFACNSRNQSTVAQHNNITFIAPAHLGETLISRATEVSLKGRSGVYDATVETEDGHLVATFRGLSRSIKGQVFEEEWEDTQ